MGHSRGHLGKLALCPRGQVRFYVESSLDGVAWRRLGSSTFQWTWAGAYVMYDGLFATPLLRGEERVFHMGVCPIWADLRMQTHLLAVTMITSFNIAARTKRQMLGRCVRARLRFMRSLRSHA
jgi:hypothetical protein